jgi:hypothetical protein
MAGPKSKVSMSGNLLLASRLCQLWQEIVPDLADWTLRSDKLKTRMCGIRCTREAVRKSLQWSKELQQPPLQLGVSRVVEEILAEMADADTAEQYFSSIFLFLDPAVSAAASNAGFASAESGQLIFSKTEKGKLLGLLDIDDEALGPIFRWSGHLDDILASAGGFSSVRNELSQSELSTYKWQGGTSSLDPQYFSWNVPEEEDQQNRVVLAGEFALLMLFENWTNVLRSPNPDAVISRINSAFDNYIAFCELLLDQKEPMIMKLNPFLYEAFVAAIFPTAHGC